MQGGRQIWPNTMNTMNRLTRPALRRPTVLALAIAFTLGCLVACDAPPRRYRPSKRGTYDFTLTKEQMERAAESKSRREAAQTVGAQDIEAAPAQPAVAAAAQLAVPPAPTPEAPIEASTAPTLENPRAAASNPPAPSPRTVAAAPAATPANTLAKPPATTDRNAAPQAPAVPPPPPPSRIELKAGELPSLQGELAAQARRDADKLGARLGLAFEHVKSTPTWVGEGGKTDATTKLVNLVASGRGQTVESAYEAAKKQLAKQSLSAEGTARPTDTVKAAFSRSPLGDFTVWLLARAR